MKQSPFGAAFALLAALTLAGCIESASRLHQLADDAFEPVEPAGSARRKPSR